MHNDAALLLIIRIVCQRLPARLLRKQEHSSTRQDGNCDKEGDREVELAAFNEAHRHKWADDAPQSGEGVGNAEP